GSAGGMLLNAAVCEGAAALDDAGVITHADQSATDGGISRICHGSLTSLFRSAGCSQGIKNKGLANATGRPLWVWTDYSRPYCLSFLRRVPRFRPSMVEALVWLLRVYFITCSSSGASTSESTSW